MAAVSGTIDFVVNGRAVSSASEATTPLLSVLRDELALRGTKFGCGTEQCGSCMVLIDGKPQHSCTP
jgi:aerobic-type carbon monoxide dehydrogenase small subunit (CoxS/CutS family)